MKSLYGKFVFSSFLVLVAGILLSYLVVNTIYHRDMKVDNDEKHVHIAEEMVSFIESTDGLDLERYLRTQAEAGYILYVSDQEDRGSFYGGPFKENSLPEGTVRSVLDGHVYHGMRDLPAETFWAGYFANDVANTVGVPFTYHDRPYALFIRPDIGLLFNELHWLTAIMFILIAAIGFIAVLYTAKKLIRPLTELTEATNQVAQERFSFFPDIRRNDEIGQLSDSFRRMVRKLEENDRARKAFISDVSHDLQSPLLNIKGYAELLGNPELPEGQRREYSEIVRDEAVRLSDLARQLLLLTSIDQITDLAEFEPLDIAAQLREVIRKYRWAFEAKEIYVSLELDEAVYPGDRELLEKVWENLLSNAVKYTPDGGEVSVRLRTAAEALTVTVEDNGPGVGPEDAQRVFDRFYRTDEARTREGGTGLGLSIVKEVVMLHGGSVKVDQGQSGGARFTVSLPCRHNQPAKR
ncbi:sensor histidine kinase [Edaphobacillus lindanitolerans]|uniref:Heme sensor protein HssS n=1 Tax=Edaphobacillus lindanitolerans TaxID=550447 RepID=A0A1U7PIY0_9BACI|nr:HAMP domain-containing sensor histidine kinase [Edaphobacillus lindanitolerans]SIT76237.1 Signal transduction histidine kinase [Edaphobacillus lindanitolerans]